MFKDGDDMEQYVVNNFVDVTDARMDEIHWDLPCNFCKITRGFQVIKRERLIENSKYAPPRTDLYGPIGFLFRCPVCKGFKYWLVYKINEQDENGDEHTRYFRVCSLPSEGIEDIDELPEEPAALRTAYRQAIRSMDANAHIAAAAMFRRALQVITRNVLGAQPSTLAAELREVVGKVHNGVRITSQFAGVGYIVKEAGNQGAHPDRDPDLLEFTSQDARDLQAIFMELVSELFVVPTAAQKARAAFLKRRKISDRSGAS